jgi:hypothetical protein
LRAVWSSVLCFPPPCFSIDGQRFIVSCSCDLQCWQVRQQLRASQAHTRFIIIICKLHNRSPRHRCWWHTRMPITDTLSVQDDVRRRQRKPAGSSTMALRGTRACRLPTCPNRAPARLPTQCGRTRSSADSFHFPARSQTTRCLQLRRWARALSHCEPHPCHIAILHCHVLQLGTGHAQCCTVKNATQNALCVIDAIAQVVL